LTFYEDEERRLKLLLVYGLKRHSNKDTCRTNEALKSSTLHIEHINSHDKTVQTRTSLSVIIVSNNGNEFLTTSDIMYKCGSRYKKQSLECIMYISMIYDVQYYT